MLRAVEPTDVDLLLQWENDPENWQVSDTLAPFSRKQLTEYARSPQDLFVNRQVRFIICRLEGREPVGTIDLFEFDPVHQRAGVGILVDKAARRERLAVDALTTLINYAFAILPMRQLHCSIMAENTASIQLFQQQGFEQCGTRKQWIRSGEGKWSDELLFQLIRPEHR